MLPKKEMRLAMSRTSNIATLRLDGYPLTQLEITALLQYVFRLRMSVLYHSEPVGENGIRLGQTGEFKSNHLIVRPEDIDFFLTDPSVTYSRLVIEPHEWDEEWPTCESRSHPYSGQPTPTQVLDRVLWDAYIDGISNGFPR
jgi:hypothetical protein